MARRDLTNDEIYEMGKKEPGSAARYLDEMWAQRAAEEQAKREKADYEAFVIEFVNAGGTKSGAKAAYDRRRDERAEKTAREAGEVAAIETR